MSISDRSADSVIPLFKKPPRTRRKHKIRKARSPRIHREITEGPYRGFTLTFDRDHPVFPRQWILSFKGILVQVSRSFPLHTWDLLVELNACYIKPKGILTEREADRERREYLKGLSREVYWDEAKKYFRR